MAEALEQGALADEVQQLLVALYQRRAQPLDGDDPRRAPALPQLRLLHPRERPLPQVRQLQPATHHSAATSLRPLLRTRLIACMPLDIHDNRHAPVLGHPGARPDLQDWPSVTMRCATGA